MLMTPKSSDTADNIDYLMLQSDLDQLVNWTKQWQLRFIVDKCTVMHLGVQETTNLSIT